MPNSRAVQKMASSQIAELIVPPTRRTGIISAHLRMYEDGLQTVIALEQ